MDHPCTYLSNTHFSTNQPPSSTIHVSNFSGHRPTAEWTITTFFWRSVLNLTPTSFICLSNSYLQCQETVNPYPVPMTCDFMPFYLISPPLLAAMGVLAESPTIFHWAGAILCIWHPHHSFLNPFAALFSFWRSKEWVR